MSKTWENIKQLVNDVSIDDVSDILHFVKCFTSTFVTENCKEITHKQIGIDERSYGKIWITIENDYIITQNLSEYYSGFSYVPSDCKFKLGDYMFYSAEDSRIAGHIDEYLTYVEPQEAPQTIDEA
jgi:hypothetical protein